MSIPIPIPSITSPSTAVAQGGPTSVHVINGPAMGTEQLLAAWGNTFQGGYGYSMPSNNFGGISAKVGVGSSNAGVSLSPILLLAGAAVLFMFKRKR